MTLNIHQYQKGTCFICANPCNPEGFVHEACAVAYFQEDKKRKLVDKLTKEKK